MSRCASAFVFAILGLTGCSQSNQTHRIVVLVGGPGINAAHLAARDINAGDRGDSIEVFIVSRGYNTSAEYALDLAGEVAKEPRTIAVVGHNNSAASLAGSQIYNAEHVVQLAPTTTAPAYSAVGPYSFRMVPDDRYQARTLADIARREARNGRVAIGYINDDYGRGLLHELQPLLRQAGIDIVTASPHVEPGDTVLFKRFIADLQVTKPDLLLWLARAPQLEMLLRSGPVPPVVASDGLELGVLLLKDLRAFKGVRYTRFIDPASTNAQFREFARRYESTGNSRINSEAVYTYDAIMLLAELIRGGADTREKLRDRLAAIGTDAPSYRGIGGEVVFDRNGDVMRPYLLALVTDSGVVAAPSQ